MLICLRLEKYSVRHQALDSRARKVGLSWKLEMWISVNWGNPPHCPLSNGRNNVSLLVCGGLNGLHVKGPSKASTQAHTLRSMFTLSQSATHTLQTTQKAQEPRSNSQHPILLCHTDWRGVGNCYGIQQQVWDVENLKSGSHTVT